MDKTDKNMIAALLIMMLALSCVLNDPCAERNQIDHRMQTACE